MELFFFLFFSHHRPDGGKKAKSVVMNVQEEECEFEYSKTRVLTVINGSFYDRRLKKLLHFGANLIVQRIYSNVEPNLLVSKQGEKKKMWPVMSRKAFHSLIFLSKICKFMILNSLIPSRLVSSSSDSAFHPVCFCFCGFMK